MNNDQKEINEKIRKLLALGCLICLDIIPIMKTIVTTAFLKRRYAYHE